MDNEPKQQESINNQESVERDPFTSVFFEIEVRMNEAEARTVELFQPLAARVPEAHELFSSIEIWQGQGADELPYDVKLNYNIFDKEDDMNHHFGQLDDEVIFPGLSEYIQSSTNGKEVSEEAFRAFDEKLHKRLVDFFSACWKKAEGKSAKTPTYLSFEDTEGEFIDMQTGETFTDEDLKEKLG